MLKRIYCLFLSFSVALTPIAGADAKSVFAEVSPSIVVVLVPDGQGSGVVVGEGIVVTNCHVVEEATEVHIKQAADARGAESYLMEAEILSKDEDNDLCLLFAGDLTKPPAAPAAEFGEAKDLVIGEDVYAIGAPQGLDLSLSRGIVAQLRGIKGKAPIVQTDAAISPGSSGGGLFNEDGKLVGITTYKQVNGESLNFAMPVEAVAALVHTAQREAEERQAQVDLWQECIKNPQYQCAWALAQQATQQINAQDRAWTLRDIAIIQIDAGDISGAKITFDDLLQSARQIESPLDRSTALWRIATRQVEDGDISNAKLAIKGALQSAKEIKDDQQRSWMLMNIATAQFKAGNVNDAKLTLGKAVHSAKQIHKENWRHSDSLKKIAVKQAEIGDISNAKTTTREISDISDRIWALINIADVQAKSGDVNETKLIFDDALRLAKLHKHYLLRNIAVKQALLGDVSSAKATAQHADDVSDYIWILIGIALAQANSGNIDDANLIFDTAIQQARQLDNARERDQELKRIAEAQDESLRYYAVTHAKSGDIKEAKLTAQQINDANFRADAMIRIAIAHSESGDMSGAKLTFDSALHAVKQIDDHDKRLYNEKYFTSVHTEFLINFVSEKAKAGDIDGAMVTFDDAMQLAQQINDPSVRSQLVDNIVIAKVQLLTDFAIEQFESGDINNAKLILEDTLEIVPQINRLLEQPSAVRKIAIAQAKIGNFTDAMQIAQSISHPRHQAQALASIAYILAKR